MNSFVLGIKKLQEADRAITIRFLKERGGVSPFNFIWARPKRPLSVSVAGAHIILDGATSMLFFTEVLKPWCEKQNIPISRVPGHGAARTVIFSNEAYATLCYMTFASYREY